MNPSFELAVDIEDYVWVMAKIGLIRFTQSDTERVVKTVRKTETRFAGYDEVKENEGKRNRPKEEIFLRENQDPLDDLPFEELNQERLKTHLPALKSRIIRTLLLKIIFTMALQNNNFGLHNFDLNLICEFRVGKFIRRLKNVRRKYKFVRRNLLCTWFFHPLFAP